jgi:hypothetical protein
MNKEELVKLIWLLYWHFIPFTNVIFILHCITAFLFVSAVTHCGSHGAFGHYRFSDRFLQLHRMDLLWRLNAGADRNAVHQTQRTAAV